MSSNDEDSSTTLYETSDTSGDEDSVYDGEIRNEEGDRSIKSFCANTMVTLQSVINLTLSNMTMPKPSSISRQNDSSRTFKQLKNDKLNDVPVSEHGCYVDQERNLYKNCDEIYFFVETMRLKVFDLIDLKVK